MNQFYPWWGQELMVCKQRIRLSFAFHKCHGHKNALPLGNTLNESIQIGTTDARGRIHLQQVRKISVGNHVVIINEGDKFSLCRINPHIPCIGDTRYFGLKQSYVCNRMFLNILLKLTILRLFATNENYHRFIFIMT